MKNMVLLVMTLVILIGIGGFVYFSNTLDQNPVKISVTPIKLKTSGAGNPILLESGLFTVLSYDGDIIGVSEKGKQVFSTIYFEKKPENESLYRELSVSEKQNTVVIAPIFTLSAYGDGGFYEYYKGECDVSCTQSVPIRYDNYPEFTSSEHAIKILTILGYPFLTDIEVDKYPHLLEKFDKVILLHNEYVTRAEFDAITNHPKVIYLYPNSLYAEIKVDYKQNQISLLRGHGFPDSSVTNGFDWQYDNTHPYEFDTECANWEFYNISNGIMLNCYPENIIYKNSTLLKLIKEF